MNPVRVTFLFHDDEQFHHFLEHNNIDTYTYNWKKGTYLVDLSTDINKSIEDVTKNAQPSQSAEQQPANPVSEFL